jgi:hypothetical protein
MSMLNINEEELKVAIVERAADDIVNQNSDLSDLVAKEVRRRLDNIFADRAQAQIEAAINDAITTGFSREYQRVDSFGTPVGEKTSIRAQLDKIVSGYWDTQVDPRSGKPHNGYGDKVTRAEWLMTQICAKDFTDQMKQSALNITGALKDGLRTQMAAHMDRLLSELFHVKSLQDQGKVEKPY